MRTEDVCADFYYIKLPGMPFLSRFCTEHGHRCSYRFSVLVLGNAFICSGLRTQRSGSHHTTLNQPGKLKSNPVNLTANSWKRRATVMSVSASSDNSEPVTPKDDANQNVEKLPDFAWMVKPCVFYKEEYSDCKSIKARFHQYFVHGETIDCKQWNEDYKNCYEWDTKDDTSALKKLIDSERQRAKDRLKAHYGNDVWESRLEPPSDWNSKLPEKINKEYESSFLKLKADELKNGKVSLDEKDDGTFLDFDASETTCSIV